MKLWNRFDLWFAYNLRSHLVIEPHWDRATRICVSKLYHNWFRQWLAACSAPNYYLNQCWNIVDWTLNNKLQWNFNRNSKSFIQENSFVSAVCEMPAILSRPQCVKQAVGSGGKYQDNIHTKNKNNLRYLHMSTTIAGWFAGGSPTRRTVQASVAGKRVVLLVWYFWCRRGPARSRGGSWQIILGCKDLVAGCVAVQIIDSRRITGTGLWVRQGRSRGYHPMFQCGYHPMFQWFCVGWRRFSTDRHLLRWLRSHRSYTRFETGSLYTPNAICEKVRSRVPELA